MNGESRWTVGTGQATYDSLDQFFIPYGGDAPPPVEHPNAAPYDAAGWRDWADVPGGGWPSSSAAATDAPGGAWEDHGAFVPHQRAYMADPASTPTAAAAAPRSRRRTSRTRRSWLQLLGSLFGALTALAFITVCVTGWMLSYNSLCALADSRPQQGAAWLWPIVVYGPWLAGCLSVLRAALNGHRAAHSWAVVVAFSGLATGLCAAGTAQTLPAMLVAGLPPLTGAICLHQFVQQLISDRQPTQTAPRLAAHKAPR